VTELDERVAQAAGSAPVHYRRAAGGYSSADRFVVSLADGRSVFVKSAEADNLAGWLRREHEVSAPSPWEVLPDSGELAAFVAGVWAAVVGLPAPNTAPTVRGVQRAQLAVALDWIDRELR